MSSPLNRPDDGDNSAGVPNWQWDTVRAGSNPGTHNGINVSITFAL